MSKRKNQIEHAVETAEPQTLEAVNIAIEELNRRMQATECDLCRGGHVESANLWRNALKNTEASIAAGGHSPDALALLRERAKEARGALDRLTADIELLPERQRLDTLRLRLELTRQRRAAFGVIATEGVFLSLPETFNPALEGFELPEGTPAAVVELFAGIKARIAPAAARLETAFAAVSAAGAVIADLGKAVEPAALEALRAARIALVNELKGYILTAAAAYDGLVEADTRGSVRAFNAGLDAEAARIAADVEAKTLKAGASADAARDAAQDAPGVLEVLARRVDPETIAQAEAGLARVLIRKAQAARCILEGELPALV